MKIFILFICIFFLKAEIYSQSFEKIKNSDTVYVYFKLSKDQIHLNTKIIKSKKIKLRDEYFFTFKNSFPLTFIHDYLSPEEIKKSKSFLKKNKDIIVTYDFITKYNLAEATDLIGHKKKVYLIDDDDIGWFSIKLKEVKVMGVFYPSIE
ncbi:hypothetical protein [Flavobacterium sp. LC2016-12]|uniref:hypothetical protein n=1 Tax=Flavobacterium sp. LC2016-12 TaxID=2783794 RepID=UPI00188ADDE7|nr:hypothetical protein [Flavobacterium sp. LC2016-12]MBF4465602.1 hypothetical protein [Flavobacterium sp. LC2016-12]